MPAWMSTTLSLMYSMLVYSPSKSVMSLMVSVTAPVLPATDVTGAEGRLVSCEPSTAGRRAEASS